MEMLKLWNVGSLYNYNAFILSNIVFVTARIFCVCIYTVRYRTFDQIGILESQTFCGQKQRSCCIALFRLKDKVNETSTFKQRVPTLMIALQHRPWHFILRLALCTSLTFCGLSLAKLWANLIPLQAFPCKLMIGFAVDNCIWWGILRSSHKYRLESG